MTLDALLLGETPYETKKKSIPSQDGDLHLANHKAENVQKFVDEQEWKFRHGAGKNMSVLPTIV